MITEFPLLLFTALTGIAGGVYVGAALFPKEEKNPRLLPIVALVLLAAGCFGVLGHLGRPAMVLNVLNNPGSPLTMEGIFAGIFGILIIVDLVLIIKNNANRAVRIACAVAGAVLMLVVTHLYTVTYGAVAWTAACNLPLFVIGDLAAGLALWMALVPEAGEKCALATCAMNALLALNLVWQATVFSGLGESILAILVGAALAVAAAVVAYLAPKGRVNVPYTIIAGIAIAAMVISRYGFYMASVI